MNFIRNLIIIAVFLIGFFVLKTIGDSHVADTHEIVNIQSTVQMHKPAIKH